MMGTGSCTKSPAWEHRRSQSGTAAAAKPGTTAIGSCPGPAGASQGPLTRSPYSRSGLPGTKPVTSPGGLGPTSLRTVPPRLLPSSLSSAPPPVSSPPSPRQSPPRPRAPCAPGLCTPPSACPRGLSRPPVTERSPAFAFFFTPHLRLVVSHLREKETLTGCLLYVGLNLRPRDVP